MLGRLSFTEFHFFMVLLVAFQLKGSTPRKYSNIYTFYVYLWFIESEFLPEDELLIVELQIVPLTSLFTFAIAIVVSTLLSNLFLVYQHKSRTMLDMKRGKLRFRMMLKISRNSLETV